MLSRAFSGLASLKTKITDAAESFDHEQKTWLAEKKAQDGALFVETKGESLHIPDVVSPAVAKTSATLRDLLKKQKSGSEDSMPEELPMHSFDKVLRAKEERESGVVRTGSIKLPWEEAGEDADALKSHIFALAANRDAMLESLPESDAFPFDLESSYPVIMKLLDLDPALGRLRFDLVPKKIKEPIFWRRYFYRVHLLQNDPASKIPVEPQHTAVHITTSSSPSSPPATRRPPASAPVPPLPAADSEVLFVAPSISPVAAVPPNLPELPRSNSYTRHQQQDNNALPTAQELREVVPVPQNLSDSYDEGDYSHGEEFVSDMYDADQWQED
ncbi:Synapse-associated protein 1 [Thoreauomyces humboldtii]|nr:Synapse-associated protein 1 [Thoreauomyces humboldtii]